MSPFLMYWHILQVNFYRNIMFLLFCIFCHMHFWNLYLYLSNKTFNFFGVILHFILLLKNEPFKTKNWTTCITILCHTNHFSKILCLFCIYPLVTPFSLKIKNCTLSQDRGSMFYNWQFEWMNTSLTFSMEI